MRTECRFLCSASGTSSDERGDDVVGVAVEVAPGAVVAGGGAGVSVAGGDLDVAEADAGVEHGRDEGMAQHVRVHPRHAYAGGGGQVFEAAGCGVSARNPSMAVTNAASEPFMSAAPRP